MTASRPGVARRDVLRGVGASLLLPFLPSLGGRSARAEDATQVPFVAIQVPNGIHMPSWTPERFGRDVSLPPILAPLADFSDRTSILSGLVNRPAMMDLTGTHARESACWLTAHAILPTQDIGALGNGWSIDQRLADARVGSTPLPSVSVVLDRLEGGFSCDNFSSLYFTSLSWRGDRPVQPLDGPVALWAYLFDSPDTILTDALRERRREEGRSVLDTMLQDAARIRSKLGREDDQRLDAYLEGVRALEQRLDSRQAALCAAPSFTATVDPRRERELMLDLVAKAIECGLSSVFTVQLGYGGASDVWREFGHTENHHTLSHHGGSADKHAQLEQIGVAQSQIVARFLAALDALPSPSGSGTRLDDSVILYGSGISDGDLHNYDDLPVAVFGGAGGRLRTGEHLDLTDRALGDLHVTLLQAAGLDVTTHGDGTGPIDALLA